MLFQSHPELVSGSHSVGIEIPKQVRNDFFFKILKTFQIILL
jgi:hypothetical protein